MYVIIEAAEGGTWDAAAGQQEDQERHAHQSLTRLPAGHQHVDHHTCRCGQGPSYDPV